MSSFPRTNFGWKLRALLGSFELDTLGARLGKIVSGVAILGFAVGATLFFKRTFDGLTELEGIGIPLMWRVIGITLATIFIMLIISNLITGISVLYKSPEITFLLARPLSYRSVFMSGFTDNLVYSSWSLAVLGIPLVAAWAWSFGLPLWVPVVCTAFGLAPLVVVAAGTATGLLMLLMVLSHRTSPRATVLLLITLTGLTIGFFIAQRNSGLVVEGRARTSTVERYLAGLRKEAPRPVMPSQWMTGAMRAFERGDLKRGAFLTIFLTLTAIVSMRALGWLASKIYYPSWTAFGDMTGARGLSERPNSAWKFTKSWLPNPLNSLLRKDLLMFARNPNQWAQFLMLLTFLLLYLMNLIWVSSRFNFANPDWRVIVMFLNFAFTGFILATLSVRFVYPLISLEGRSFWVVRKSPISIGLLFWEKFFLAFAVFMGLCEVIVFVSNRVLHVSGAMMILTTSATFMMGATLTGLAIGMGSLMPDFRDESPMRIASTPGGVLTVILSLVYVGLMVLALAWPTQGYFSYLLGRGQFPTSRALQALAIVSGLNIITLFVPLRLGHNAIRTRDS